MFNNYEYIISSLPVLFPNWDNIKELDIEAIVSEIKAQCGEKDNDLIDLALRGFEESSLDTSFYTQCLKEKNSFIRDYFYFDLKLRNEKVLFLNRDSARKKNKGLILFEEENIGDSQLRESLNTSNALEHIFNIENILEREKALSSLLWQKIEEVSCFDYFNINAILSYICKLQIIKRWLKLDPTYGKSRFKQMVEDIIKNSKSSE